MRIVPLFVLFAACTDPALAELEENADKWSTAGPSTYVYVVSYDCFCPSSSALVNVEDDEVTEIEWGGEVAQEVIPERLVEGMNGVFAHLRIAHDDGPASFEVTYSEIYGYPLTADVDPIENAVDDEWGFTITDFIDLI